MYDLYLWFSTLMGFLALALGGGSALVGFLAAWLFIASGGEKKGLRKALRVGSGSVIGAGLAGGSLLAPQAFDRLLLATGETGSLWSLESSFSCDKALQAWLEGQPAVDTGREVNELIRRLQFHAVCSEKSWSPQVLEGGGWPALGCFQDSGGGPLAVGDTGGQEAYVGEGVVPWGLRQGGELAGAVAAESRRDRFGNRLVYFVPGWGPGDGAVCWLYAARTGSWHRGGSPQ